MRKPAEREINRTEVLKKSFVCLMENGLENASTRLLSEYTGMKTSSLYYWFENKNELVVDATEFGLNIIITRTLNLAEEHKEDIDGFCEEFIVVFKEYFSALKMIIHVATSPTYSKIIIRKNNMFESHYQKFAENFALTLGMQYETIRPIMNLFSAIVADCAIWENWEQFEQQINYLIKLLKDKKVIQ